MNRICYGVFAQLSRPAKCLKRIRELSFEAGQGELEYGAARFVGFCPQPASMGVDDRPADRQPHSRSAGFGTIECLENALAMARIKARPGIAHCHEDARVVLLGADQQLSWLRLNRAHCLNRVQSQVQDDLLQLNAVAMNGKQSVSKPGLDRYTVSGDCVSRQHDHLIDSRIEIKTLLSRRRFFMCSRMRSRTSLARPTSPTMHPSAC